MAHFYGTLHGSRGKVSRLGTKTSGLQVVAASWNGCVEVNLYQRDGVDCADVYLAPWQSGGTTRKLYSGPISGAAAA